LFFSQNATGWYQLNFSSDLYKAIANHSASWESWFNKDGEIMWTSPYVESVTGFTVEDCLNSADFLSMVIYAEDYALVLKHFLEAMQGSKGDGLESRVNKKDGSIIWFSFSWRQLYDEHGSCLGFRTTGQNINKRKILEEKLRLSEEKYRLLAENITDVIWVVDMEKDCYTYISPSVLQMRGYTPEEAIAQRFWDTVPTEMAEPLKLELLADYQRYQRKPDEQQCHQIVFQQYKKDGGTIWVESTFQFRINLQGGIDAVGISRNIDTRKEAELLLARKNLQLNELVSTKDKFFSIVAHDLRSPLSGILNLTEFFAMDVDHLSNDEIHQMADTLHKAAKGLYALLENLLEWSRMQQGLISFNPEPLVLYDEVEFIVDSSKSTAKSKGIDIRHFITSDSVAFADKYMLQSVLRNLVSNAIKFTHYGGEIQINTSSSTDECLVISIQDNGIGIEQAVLNNMFSLTTKNVRNGTGGESSSGLGLILVKQFVEKNGGTIWVESEVGTGTTFHFSLPCYNK
jgi:PAS domain S-box-containing protein